MPRRPHSGNKKRLSQRKSAGRIDALRTGMPALDSITGIQQVGKGKNARRIIHTNEIDEYEKRVPKPKRNKPT